MPARHGESSRVELRVDAIHEGGALPDEDGPMTDERGPFALAGRRGVDLGNEARQVHPREQFGVDRIGLVVRLGDGAKPLRVSEHKPHSGRREHILEPRPRGAGLDDCVERPIRGEYREEPLRLRDGHARRTEHALACLVDDDDNDIPCVSINTGDKHVGLLVGRGRLRGILVNPLYHPPISEANAL